jgi:hypothetical protein
MAKIFFVRHQAHGIVHEFPFSSHPTQNQVEAVARFCFQSHGFGHAKTPEKPYWTRVVEVDVLGPDELPKVSERVLAPVGENGVADAEAGKVVISGSGTIAAKGG